MTKTTLRQNIKNYLKVNKSVKNQEALTLGLAEFLQDIHLNNNFDNIGIARLTEIIGNTSSDNLKKVIELINDEIQERNDVDLDDVYDVCSDDGNIQTRRNEDKEVSE